MDFTWQINKYLFTPDRAAVMGQRNDSPQVQLGEPVNLTGDAYRTMGKRFLGGVWAT